jgi:conjugative transposon TraM protein
MKSYLKKNKAMLILPLVLIPFVILIFYILGGGEQATNKENNNQNQADGANYLLPQAEKSIEIFDKLEAYQNENLPVGSGVQNPSLNSNQDSVNTKMDLTDVQADSLQALLQNHSKTEVSNKLLVHIKRKEAAVREERKEEKRSEEKKRDVILPGKKQKSSTRIRNQETQKNSSHEAAIIKAIREQESELGELEKVFDQNMNLSRENDSLKYFLKEAREKLNALTKENKHRFALEKKLAIGFDGKKSSTSMIKAEVCETTTVLNGNRIKMRLLDDVWIDGKKAVKHSFFFGICKIKDERLNIQVSSFPLEDNFLPVDLLIHDLDGLPGLYVPDNAARRVGKEIGSRTNLSPLWSMGSDPITGIGINTADRTAQALIKRVKLRKITIKQNTLVYLINQN